MEFHYCNHLNKNRKLAAADPYWKEVLAGDKIVDKKKLNKVLKAYKANFGKKTIEFYYNEQKILNLIYNKFGKVVKAPLVLKPKTQLINKYCRTSRLFPSKIEIKSKFSHSQNPNLISGIKSFDRILKKGIIVNSLVYAKAISNGRHCHIMAPKKKHSDVHINYSVRLREIFENNISDVFNEKKLLKIKFMLCDGAYYEINNYKNCDTYFINNNKIARIFYKNRIFPFPKLCVYDLKQRKISLDYNFSNISALIKVKYEYIYIMEYTEPFLTLLAVNKLEVSIYKLIRSKRRDFIKTNNKIYKIDLAGRNAILGIRPINLKDKKTGESKTGIAVGYKYSNKVDLLNFDLEIVASLELDIDEEDQKLINENSELFCVMGNKIGIKFKFGEDSHSYISKVKDLPFEKF